MLEFNETHFRTIVNISSDAVIVIDQGMIQYVNPAAENLFARTFDDLVGTSFDYPLGVGETTEIVIPRDNQASYTAEMRVSEMDIVGEVVYLATLRDVTDVKAKERAMYFHASLQKSVHDAVIVTDLQFIIHSWNHAATAIYGWTPEEAVGKSIAELVTTQFESQQDGNRIAQDFLRQGSWQGEVIQRHKNGSDINIQSSVNLFKDDQGEALGVVAVNRDITHRKQREQALQFHASVQESVSDAVVTSDLNFRVQSWNHAAELIYGWKAEEIIGKSIDEALQSSFENEAARRIFRQKLVDKGHWSGEAIQHRKDGTEITVFGSVTMLKDDNGQAYGIVSVIRDISEQKSKEQELQFYASVQASVHDAVITYDRDYRIQSWNLAAERIYGWTAEEVIGQDISAALGTKFASEDLRQSRRQEVLTKGYWSGEAIQHRKDGSTVIVLGSFTVFKDDKGEPHGIVSVLHDITERKRRERELIYHASVQAGMSDAVIATNMEQVIQSWNQAAETIYGWRAEEVIGKNGTEILQTRFENNQDRERIMKDFVEKGDWQGEVIQQHKDGYDIYIQASANIFTDENDQPIGIISVNRDITDRKQTVLALQAKSAEDQEFQDYLRGLHDITIELTQTDDLTDFYKRTVEFGLEHFKFERFGLLLYDREQQVAHRTYGTSADGKLSDERGSQFDPVSLTGILGRAIEKAERFVFDESVTLYDNGQPIGVGWNAVSVIWNGRDTLGWLAIDNAIEGKPATKPMLDILGLYAMTVGTLLARKQEQTALRESEARYRLLAENINDVIVQSSAIGDYMYLSPSVRSILGYEPEELVGQSSFSLVHPDDIADVQASHLKAQQGELENPAGIHRFYHKDGHQVWLDATSQVIRSEETGELLGFITSLRDITDRKLTEDKLQAKSAEDGEFQEYLRALHEITIELTQIDDMDNFCKRTIEMGREKLGFERVGIYLYDNDQNLVRGTFGTDIEGKTTDESHVSLTPNPDDSGFWPFSPQLRITYTEDTELHTRDEAINVIGWKAVAAIWDGRTYVGWISTDNAIEGKPATKPMLDILGLYAMTVGTLLARKQEQTALRESEARYRLLAGNITDAIVQIDNAGTFIYVSPSVKRILGYDVEELLGAAGFDLIHPDDIPHMQAGHLEAFNEPTPLPNLVYRLRHKNGHYVWFEATRQTIISETTGEIDGFVASMRDVTQRKQTEEALQHYTAEVQDLYNNAPCGYHSIDKNGVFVQINDTELDWIGYTREEVINKLKITDVITAESQRAFREQFAEFIETGSFSDVESEFVRKDGSLFHVLVNSTAVYDDAGEFLQSRSTLYDITDRHEALKALRESEEKFRLLVKAAPVAIVISDETGSIKIVNDKAESIFGYKRDELLSKPIEVLVPKDKRKQHIHHRASYINQPSVRPMGIGLELVGRHKDGSRFPVEIELSHIQTANGILAMSFVDDITERKGAEAALQQSAAEIHDLYNNAPCGYHSLDNNGVFVRINDTELEWLGYERDEVIGTLKFTDVVSENTRHIFHDTFPTFKEIGWVKDLEYELIRKDGTILHVLVNATAIYDESGSYLQSRSTLYDVSDRQTALMALRESEEKFRQLVETMRGGLAMYDEQDLITYANDQFCEQLGYTSEELIGTSSIDYVDDDNSQKIKGELDKRRFGESTTYELVVRHKDGHPVYLLVSGSPLVDNRGKYTGSFAVTTDISVQKQAEETLRIALAKEKELNDLKSRFVSMASHEFRTPLASIQVMTDTLAIYRDKLTEEGINNKLSKIQEQIDHLKNIMEDVLQLARIQARRIEFNPVRLDLDSLCRSVIDEFQDQPDIQHELIYSCNLSLYDVHLDKRLMRQIINNLVSNAIKYTPHGKPVNINLEQDDNTVVLKVQDQGIGIPEEDMKHLFEPFHRAKNVGTISGTGLGLTITKESVELHGGTISVDSQVDVGTTVTVKIPLNRSDRSTGDGEDSGD